MDNRGRKQVATQGQALTETQVSKIIAFLSSTDMTIAQIAARMGCSRSVVAAVNRKNSIRDYAGCRAKWKTHSDREEELAEYMTSSGFLVS